MTVKEVAKCLGVSEGFIRSLIRENFIHFIRVPRIMYRKRDWTAKTINTFEIEPEEVESIEICIVNGELVDCINWMLEDELSLNKRILLTLLLDEAKKYKMTL